MDMIISANTRQGELEKDSFTNELEDHIEKLDQDVVSLVPPSVQKPVVATRFHVNTLEKIDPPNLALRPGVQPLPISSIRIPELEAWNPGDELPATLRSKLYVAMSI